MCGLFLFKQEKTRIDGSVIKKISDFVASRGLETNTLIDEDNIFIHSVLPFTNLENYQQPIKHKKGNFMFTGEIFNWKALKYKNKIECSNDSEFFVETFDSKDIIHEMDGFWGFAGIDKEKNIIAMTDFLSIKPIYYRTDLKAVCSDPYPLSLIAPCTKDEMFFSSICKFGYDSQGNTPWKEIKQLAPGHVYYEGKIGPYWDWDKIQSDDLEISMLDSVFNRINTLRDNNILLSGGLDSSIVFSLFKKFKQEINCFYINDGDKSYIDSLKCQYSEIKLKNNPLIRKKSIELNQTPVDLGSVIPQYLLALELKKNNTYSVLTGDGADELFSGYNRANFYDSQQSDIFHELPYYHLPRLDKLMMRNLIEVRSPFLSPKVIKFALNTSYEKRKNKQILKDTFENYLPLKILNRAKKPLKTNAVRNDLLGNTIKNIKLFEKIFK